MAVMFASTILSSSRKNNMEKVLVSACLLGHPCRWHGRKVPVSKAVKKFMRYHSHVAIIPVCPEMLGGLPTPRAPVKVRDGRAFETCADKELRSKTTGAEVTDAFQAGAQKALALCKKHNIKKAILMKTSPSCSRYGFAGKLLRENGIEVIDVF